MMTHYVDLKQGQTIHAYYSTEQHQNRSLQCYDETGHIILATLVKPWQGMNLNLDHATTCSATTAIIATDKPMNQQHVEANTLYLFTGK